MDKFLCEHPIYLGHRHCKALDFMWISMREGSGTLDTWAWVVKDGTYHIAPEEILGQKVVTIKDDCSIKSYGFCRSEKHKFQNTFHQPFKRCGNPDMHFVGTLKIFFQILNVFWSCCGIQP